MPTRHRAHHNQITRALRFDERQPLSVSYEPRPTRPGTGVRRLVTVSPPRVDLRRAPVPILAANESSVRFRRFRRFRRRTRRVRRARHVKAVPGTDDVALRRGAARADRVPQRAVLRVRRARGRRRGVRRAGARAARARGASIPTLVTPDSPTQRPGRPARVDVRAGRAPRADALARQRVLARRAARVGHAHRAARARTPIRFVAEPKLDGLAISLQYEDGALHGRRDARRRRHRRGRHREPAHDQGRSRRS